MDERIGLLHRIISIPSVTGSTGEAGDFLLEWCRSNGLNAELERGALVVNPNGKDLLLLGHFDNVPGEIPVRIEGDVLWGRGSVDAKGPLCAALLALKEMPELRERVMLVGVPDEEGSSETARRLRDRIEERPCIILEPSGWDGITISYNGRLLLEIEIEAPPSHSGHDQPFSPELAVDLFCSIRELSNPRLIGIEGNITRTAMKLDFRYPPGEAPQIPAVKERIRTRVIEDTKPYQSDKRSPLVRSFMRGIRSAGGEPVFKRKTGTADMNVLGEKWRTPIIAYGPGDGRLDHTDEERIDLNEYIRSIGIVQFAIRDFLKNVDKDNA
ncbi:MAG: M20/M25/M40 family metallo-hydrolase [Thermoplasmatota archaeon]